MTENSDHSHTIRPLSELTLLLVIKFIVACLIILFGGLALAPDEAQYWTWSRALDWGYYSKPPGIAWQIFLTSAAIGNNELGVRLGAPILGFFQAYAVYFVARSCHLSQKTSFWAAVVMAFSPLGIFLSVAATTDAGSILFLTLAVGLIAKGINSLKGPQYILAGLCIMLGALYKWTAYIVWPFLFFFLPFFPHLRKRSLIWGVLISLIALVPTIYWNATHEWATFQHIFSTLFKATGIQAQTAKGGNFWEFFGAQAALVSPLYFILLLCGWGHLYWHRREHQGGLVFCGTFTLVILLFMAFAISHKMQPNWAAYLYPPGMVIIAWYAHDRLKGGRVWLHAATWLSILMTLAPLAIPSIQAHSFVKKWQIPYSLNPFRQNLGWANLGPALQSAGYDPSRDFLFSDKYQMASLLSFYAQGQKRAYFFNLGQSRKNQFSYWPEVSSQEAGKTGFFVVAENSDQLEKDLPWYEEHYRTVLSDYCDKVEAVGVYPLFQAYGKTVKFALIFRCRGYNGKMPPAAEKY